VRHALTFAAFLVAWSVSQTATARADACVADKSGDLICGTGKDALRLFAATTSPSKTLAFAWRTGKGQPQGGDDIPDNDVENVLVRITDGVVLSRLGGTYWMIGPMRENRYDLVAAWSPDNRAVVEVANSRWDNDSLAYYRIDGDTAAKLDLRELVKSATLAKARVPAQKRYKYSFRIPGYKPATLDAHGRIRLISEIYVPKSDEDSLDYNVQVDVVAKGGKLSGRIVSIQRTKAY
jgi:hypothetical protein